MFRVKIALVVIGGILCYFGYREFSVSRGATKDPLTVELMNLEKDSETGNSNLAVGEHWAIYPAVVYEYETSSPGEQVSDTSKVNFAYYPIISDKHQFFKKMMVLVAQYGDVDSIPEKSFPSVDEFTVLVKTKRFGTVGSIPMDDWGEEKGVTGLVINRIKTLKGEERDLIQQSFPKVDLDKVLILEEGRTPTSSAGALGMIAGGALLIAMGILWMIGVAKSDPVSTGAATNRRAF